MRAKEILSEAAAPIQTAPDGSKLIFTSGNSWLWQVPASTYDVAYNKYKSDKWNPALPVPANAGIIYYVSDQIKERWDSSTKSIVKVALTPDQGIAENFDLYYRFVTVVGDELVNLAGRYKMLPAMLKKLAKLTGATHAPTISSDDVKHHVLHVGQVTHKKIKKQEYELAPLSDGSKVYKVPKDLLWTVGMQLYVDNIKDWDTRWEIDSPIAGTYAFVSKGGHIVRLHYPQNKAHAALKEIRELVAREHLTLGVDLPDAPAQAVGKPKVVKPGSVMHKMLAYIAEHPGANRSDWFVKHLGRDPQGMQGWTSDTAHDGVAASMGWIRNEATGGKYSLSITPVGKLVLARLNSGQPVKHTKQV
jgi:hypothetical protein